MRVVAILETMWDWRGQTSEAGYREAPRYFRINPKNYSGRRLYKLVGPDARLLVTNACRELATSAKGHGKPDPIWLAENLQKLDTLDSGFDVLLVCGKVAQKCYQECAYRALVRARVIEIPHPAARGHWNAKTIAETAEQIQSIVSGS
ncbi:hypothetical protein LCGC14_0470460 [marine sediment metagenome]|uniref:Uracil-DNA glycosylase-like domain-containing protein n=1 Tax=marine sediment metagenome TaxID=412755 RepID=A0A0F9SV30_9ZZZZ